MNDKELTIEYIQKIFDMTCEYLVFYLSRNKQILLREYIDRENDIYYIHEQFVLYSLSINELMGIIKKLNDTYPTIDIYEDLNYYIKQHDKYGFDYLYDEFFAELRDYGYFSVLPKDIIAIIRKEVDNDILRIIDISQLYE